MKKIKKFLQIFVCGVLIFQLAGCGTIFYPQRKGQRAGRVDAGVAILDGLGLLLFIIPGVIAFAVDFSNGTIYLPNSNRSSLDLKDYKQVHFDPRHYSTATIEKLIAEETGQTVKLHQSNMEITRLKSIDDMLTHFAQVRLATKMASSR